MTTAHKHHWILTLGIGRPILVCDGCDLTRVLGQSEALDD